MQGLLVVVVILITVGVDTSEERSLDYLTNKTLKDCAQLPEPILSDILGPAFNSRYMSIDKPPVLDDEAVDGSDGASGKRGISRGLYPSFYVEEDHVEEVGHVPAWDVNHARDTANPVMKPPRSKRQLFNSLLNDMSHESRSARSHRGRGVQKNQLNARPWECEGKIRWLDLGAEYFPRYLRTVECAKTRCWYGHYQCVPRSFTVKILRRRTGECVPSGQLRNIGVEGLPGELRELWVWEERAVNFCCDCAAQ
ncbi:protein trunk [Malaya genurostris]|uniref:protein trunk n=1 Tax=Malaya genurostris TaxID=325434 RepID=UPI0026F3F16C|nr:protein trunk [Malaya genurostris]